MKWMLLSGAFMMVDKKVLDNVGSFDEDYFMYAEDIDLSYRIQKAACPATGGSYKNFYFADTSIIHFKGESTAKQSVEYLNNFYGTMVLFVKKHYPKLSGGLYILLLKILIALKKLVASKEQTTQNKILPSTVYMIADEEIFKEEELQKHFSQVQQAEKISTAEKGSAVIFCEPYVSFTEMISSMQENKNQYSFFIHADSSKSIVGSGNKNYPGIAIALHQ